VFAARGFPEFRLGWRYLQLRFSRSPSGAKRLDHHGTAARQFHSKLLPIELLASIDNDRWVKYKPPGAGRDPKHDSPVILDHCVRRAQTTRRKLSTTEISQPPALVHDPDADAMT
jgi:hypothetical protein